MRVYVDTSVFGGVFDPEFERGSKLFFEQAAAGRFDIYVSIITRREIEKAPKQVQGFYESKSDRLHSIEISDEAINLQASYMARGILTPKSIDDAMHVALASVTRCDMIISWNFRHIVHQQKIAGFHNANILAGYPPIQIYSPLQVLDYGKEF